MVTHDLLQSEIHVFKATNCYIVSAKRIYLKGFVFSCRKAILSVRVKSRYQFYLSKHKYYANTIFVVNPSA